MTPEKPFWPWRDRTGRPISSAAADDLLRPEGFPKRIVGRTEVGPCMVSTVHLVVGHPCHGVNDGPCTHPDAENGWCMNALFETMTMCNEPGSKLHHDWDKRHYRWHTLVEAIRGHEAIVKTISGML